MKHWTQIFKALANFNRLKTIEILAGRLPLAMTVTEISDELDISFRATSRHLLLLASLDILTSRGKDGHVYYSYNQNMPREIKRVVELFLRSPDKS